MFPFFPKKKKEKKKNLPMPKWMLWMVAALIAYAMIVNPNEDTSSVLDKPSPVIASNPQDSAEPQEEKKNSFFDPIKKLGLEGIDGKFFPETTIKLSSQDNEIGKGSTVNCGQQATVKYTSYRAEEEGKQPIETDRKITFTVGEQKTFPALDKGVLGMSEGGKRTIMAPGYMAYGSEGFIRDDVPVKADINFEVEMLDVFPKTPFSDAYRILGDLVGQTEGYVCNSQAKINLTIWDMAGKKIYDSKTNATPLSFVIGKSEVMFALEYGVLKMSEGLRRNIIVPPVMQKTLLGKEPLIKLPLPHNETVIMYVEALP